MRRPVSRPLFATPNGGVTIVAVSGRDFALQPLFRSKGLPYAADDAYIYGELTVLQSYMLMHAIHGMRAMLLEL